MRLFNPEIQRYLWLNFSLFRVLTPLAAIAIGLLIPHHLMEGLNNAQALESKRFFTQMYMWFYGGIVLYFGNVRAGSTFAEELRGKTWDFQRTSALKPLHLVIGKVVGATCYTWYAGLLALGAAWYFAPPDLTGLPYFMMGLICAGIVGQVTAFAYSISSDDSASFPGIIVSIIVVSMFSSFLEGDRIATLEWYGYVFEKPIFYCMTTALLGFWVFRAAVCMMRRRMLYRNLPFDFLFFVLTVGVYCTGFLDPEKPIWLKAMVFYAAVLPCLFWSFMLEAGNLNGYKRFFHALYHGERRRFLEHLPRWTIPLALSVAAFGIYLTYAPVTEMQQLTHLELTVLLTSIMCFILRDGIVLHLFLLRGNESFGSFKAMVFFLFAYILLPGLVLSAFEDALKPQNLFLSEAEGTTASVWEILRWFWPQMSDDALAALFPPAAQVLVAGYFLARKVQTIRKDSAEEKSPAG
jgi:hypothetical protein